VALTVVVDVPPRDREVAGCARARIVLLDTHGVSARDIVERVGISTDPQLEAKVRDIVGLYLNPSPDKTVVLCVDEKSRVRALDRTAPILPIMPGVPEKQTYDYVRHGIITLFGALEVATGRVEQACLPGHRQDRTLTSAMRGQIFCQTRTLVRSVISGSYLHQIGQRRYTRNPRKRARVSPSITMTVHDPN